MNAKLEHSLCLRGGALLYFLYFLSVLYLFVPPAFSQRASRSTVDGVVTEADGTPVANARVVLETSDGKNPRGARTDAKGRFAFRSLRHGFYDLRASHDNRSSEWVRHLVVRSGTIVTVTLVLPAKNEK